MKRYFSMSLTLFAFSGLNVLTYFLLGFIMGDSAFSGIFSIVYPLQFVVSLLSSFFASASNIRANKEENRNCVYTGMILGLIFGILIFVPLVVFGIDGYIIFMNMDAEIFRTFTMMAICQLFLAFVCNLVTEKLYYENKDLKANLCNLGFIILNLASVTISALITKNQLAIFLTNLIALFVYVSIWFAFNIKKFKFDFSVLKNFKYESRNIVSETFMLLIYLFGYRVAFSFGEEYYRAITFTNLITDPLWDAVQVKIAKIDISQSCYNYKKALKYSAVVTLFYVAIAIVLFFSLFQAYNVVLSIGIIFLIIQISDMLVYVVQSNLETFLQLEYSPTKTTIITLICKVVRTVLAVCLFTPFNTDIAQISSSVLMLSVLLVLRYKNFKMDADGFLVRKERQKATETGEG